jgi:serine/threonine protein kinase
MSGCFADNTILDLTEGRRRIDEPAIEEHLASCDGCRHLIAAAVGQRDPQSVARAATVPSPPTHDTRILQPGTAVDRYVTVELLGRGGMGVVYRAYDPELDRQVAVKLVRTDVGGGEQLRQRLIREAQAMAKLSHPNVVTVHDTGSFGDDVFIAMELVDGGTLGDWLAATPRVPMEIVEQYMRAASGLQAAHAAGLVHRDFKPDNVLVGRDGRVRVTDFGLALPTESKATPDGPTAALERAVDRLTKTGAQVGTPAYMAPEQMKGEPTDERADVFSFCVSLYEALYRERPFVGDNLQAVCDAIAANRVRPEPRGSSVPAPIRRVLLRGLRAVANDRYQTMTELLAALAAATRPRRRRWQLALGAIGAMAAAALAGPLLQPSHPVQEPSATIGQSLTTPLTSAASAESAAVPQSRATKGAIVVRVAANDARIEVDGAVVSQAAHSVRIDGAATGDHLLRVSAPGYRSYRKHIKVGTNATAETVVSLIPIDAHEEKPRAPEPAPVPPPPTLPRAEDPNAVIDPFRPAPPRE